jgi:hypothetical protein
MRQTEALRDAVQNLRAQKFEQIPAELVDTILKIETEHVANRDVASEKVAAAIQKHVAGLDQA